MTLKPKVGATIVIVVVGVLSMIVVRSQRGPHVDKPRFIDAFDAST